MARQEKKDRRSELREQVMVGVDGEEREVGDFFSDDDFDESKDKAAFFVRHDALLRVAKRAFRGIKARRAKSLGIPQKENDWCAAVEVAYHFGSGHRMAAVADCRSRTASPGFQGYTTALAETRASGRALRWALGLEIVTQEEVTNIEELIDRAAREPMLEQQRALIEKKFIKEHGKTLSDISKIIGKNVVTLDQLTRGEATSVLESLNE